MIVRGLHFSWRGAALSLQRCHFNQSLSPATFRNGTALECASPPLTQFAFVQGASAADSAVRAMHDRCVTIE